MSPEQNRAVLKQVKDELWNQGRTEVAQELFDARFVNHDPMRPDVQTRDQFVEYVIEVRTAFPDFRVTILDEIAEGDRVALRWEVTGRHQKEIMGIPATGRSISVSGMTIYRLAEGRVVECWWNMDSMAMMRQLGALPELVHA
jgi:steroid delta-isomerase-like uncharacterized protein